MLRRTRTAPRRRAGPLSLGGDRTMRRLALLPGLALLGLALSFPSPASRGEEKNAGRTLGTIERLDPAFDELIGKDAKLEVLTDGHDWTEGPVWVPQDGGFLLFSDI